MGIIKCPRTPMMVDAEYCKKCSFIHKCKAGKKNVISAHEGKTLPVHRRHEFGRKVA